MGRESEARTFSLLPSFPARLYFLIIAIYIGIPSGNLSGGESLLPLTGAHNKLFVDEWPRSAIKFKDNLIV